MNDLPPLGAHLATPRRGYVHHGVHVGGGRVVHYAGLGRRWRRGPVEEVPLEHFAGVHGFAVVPHPDAAYGGAAVAERARSRLGENNYHLLRNNCEHFAQWCVTGRHASRQADAVVAPIALLKARVLEVLGVAWNRARPV